MNYITRRMGTIESMQLDMGTTTGILRVAVHYENALVMLRLTSLSVLFEARVITAGQRSVMLTVMLANLPTWNPCVVSNVRVMGRKQKKLLVMAQSSAQRLLPVNVGMKQATRVSSFPTTFVVVSGFRTGRKTLETRLTTMEVMAPLFRGLLLVSVLFEKPLVLTIVLQMLLMTPFMIIRHRLPVRTIRTMFPRALTPVAPVWDLLPSPKCMCAT